MAFARSKVIKGHTYWYWVESFRDGKRVRQRVLKYLGKKKPRAFVIPKGLSGKLKSLYKT